MKEPRLFDEFEQVYERWRRGEVTQGQAADLLGRSVRTFRRYVRRYEAAGLEGLADGRGSGSGIGASPDEISSLVTLYAERYASWSVAAFHREYRDRHGGSGRTPGFGNIFRGSAWFRSALARCRNVCDESSR